jgi:ribosomal protein S12 methylthiotransferase
LNSIKEEIYNLPESVKELILIGQNTTSWGKDLPGHIGLSDLIEEIAPLFDGWIRFLYFHPLAISANLLTTMKNIPNVLNYLDIPLQHISDSVLRDMNRGYDRKEIGELLGLIKSFGDFTIRTTFIVGFPSETEKDFEELCTFIEKKDIDHTGIFAYSHEEGSKAFSMRCPPEEMIKRRMAESSEIIDRKALTRNEKFIGQKMEVLIDGIEEGEYYGRTKTSAPDIDPVAWISSGGKKIEIGEIYPVAITDVLGCDIAGEITLK